MKSPLEIKLHAAASEESGRGRLALRSGVAGSKERGWTEKHFWHEVFLLVLSLW